MFSEQWISDGTSWYVPLMLFFEMTRKAGVIEQKRQNRRKKKKKEKETSYKRP